MDNEHKDSDAPRQEGSGNHENNGLWDDEPGEDSDEYTPAETTQQPAGQATYTQSLKDAGKFGTFGLNLLFATVIGYFIGHYMDRFFDTKPVFTIIWTASGVVFAILELIKMIKIASRIGDDPGAGEK